MQASNCTFIGNSATENGGGIHVERSDTDRSGSPLLVLDGSVFKTNSARSGAGVALAEIGGHVQVRLAVVGSACIHKHTLGLVPPRACAIVAAGRACTGSGT